MADTSDLHPAVMHALRTGKIDQALAAAQLNPNPTAQTGQALQIKSSRRTSNLPPLPTVAEDDAFYEQFNNDPFGRRI